jgi:hypothetical protein
VTDVTAAMELVYPSIPDLDIDLDDYEDYEAELLENNTDWSDLYMMVAQQRSEAIIRVSFFLNVYYSIIRLDADSAAAPLDYSFSLTLR